MLKKIFFILTTALIVAGCTRDDICPEGTPTTPLLIIKFMDNSAPTQVKEVPNLRIALTSNEEETVFSAITDTIFEVPLNPSLPTVQYTFTKDSNSTEGNENSDNIRFRYGIGEDVYINRACAFKTTYTNLSAEVRNEGAANTNWMLRLEITNDTVENEDVTHITVFH